MRNLRFLVLTAFAAMLCGAGPIIWNGTGIKDISPDASSSTGGKSYVNDGTGALTWGYPVGGPLRYNETYDPQASSDRNFSTTAFSSTGDSPGNNIHEMNLTVIDHGAFNTGGYTLLKLNGSSQGADKPYLSTLTSFMDYGDGVTPTTLANATGWSHTFNVSDQATVNSVNIINYGVTAAAGSSIGNYTGLADAGNFAEITGGFVGVALQDNVTHIANNYNSMSVASNITASDQSVNGLSFTPTLGAIDGQVNVVTSGGNWTTVGGVTALSETSQITTQTNNYMGVNIAPNITTSAGLLAFNAGPNITNSTGYVGFSHHPQIGTSTSVMQAFEDGTNVTTSTLGYTGVNLHPNLALVNGSVTGFNMGPTAVGDGTGSAVGLNINMSGASNFAAGQTKAIQTQGGLGFGDVNFDGKVTSSLSYPIVNDGGNPGPINTFNVNYTSAPGATIANIDAFGFGPIMSVNAGAGSTLTSGGFGLGLASLGMVDLFNLGAGASLDHATGSFVGLVASGGSGHIDNLVGYRTVPINGGATTTLDNFYAFKFDEPAGPWATTSWGLYSVPSSAENWIGGHLKIGGSEGSTDRVSSGTLALEVTGNSAFDAVNVTGLTASLPVKTDGSKNLVSGAINLASGEVTGTLPIGKGGTGQVTAAAAFGALSPLTTKGDVLAFSTLNARLPVGTDGQVLSADSGQSTGLNWITLSSMTNPMTTDGDIIYGGAAGAPTRLAAGTSVQVLHSGATPSWSAVSLTTDVSGILPGANGGTGVNSTATFPTSGVVVTEAATETLSNKSFSTAPLPSVDNTIDLGSSSLRWRELHVGPASVVFHNDATNTNKLNLVAAPSASRTLTLPDATDTVVGKATTDTFTNKSIDGGTNTFTGIPLATAVSGVLPAANGGTGQNSTATFPASGVVVTEAGTETITNKTISGASNTLTVLAGSQLSGQVPAANGGTGVNSTATFPTSGVVVTEAAAETLTNKTLGSTNTLTGATAASFTNTGTVTLPTATDTLVARATTDTLTNKTINGASNTLTVLAGSQLSGQVPAANGGTGVNSTATFPTSGVVVTEAATETLTNKTLTSPVIGTIVNTGTLTLPTSTDTLVGRATTDTLTNKTISGASNTITNVSLTTGVTGTLPIANGGTGQVTANDALNALLPSQATNANKVLQTDGTNTSWASVAATVTTTRGDMIRRGASADQRFALGQAGKRLRSDGTDPNWSFDAFATKTAAYTITDTDGLDDIIITSGSGNITLPAASTNSGRVITVKNESSSANSNVSRAGSDTIDGDTAFGLLSQNSFVRLISDGGTIWHKLGNQSGQDYVYGDTGNGKGSGNTQVRRFTNSTSSGNSISYADDSTNGGSFTINATGLYAISYSDRNDTNNSDWHITRNSTTGTTSITSELAKATTALTLFANLSATVWLTSGDVIRFCSDATGTPSTSGAVQARITRIQ